MALLYILWILLAYLVGSAPFGLLVSRASCGQDPRTGGSGNVGATNVARLCGPGWGALTLALDILKGLAPVAVAMSFNQSATFLSLTALAAVLGHVFSPFLGFRGGKAVATTIGVFLPLAFWPLLAAVLLCVLTIAASGFVSLGSLVLVTAMPVLCILLGKAAFLPLSFGIMGLVYWRHKENILRLARGEEKPWRSKEQI